MSTFSTRQLKRAAIAVGLVTLAVFIFNLFLIGGDENINIFNSLVSPALAVIVSILAIINWRKISSERRTRTLWLGLTVGWALWAVAEAIWAVYVIVGQEVPYPSLADIFWLSGYIPLLIGFRARIWNLPRPGRLQAWLIWGVSVITVLLVSVFIFRPILQDFDPERVIEVVLNTLYPLADLLLVILAWRLLFTYEQGVFGSGLRLLTIGFILMTTSDFLFTYATWEEIYYPDSQATLLSRFGIDVPYIFSYLLWILGIAIIYYQTDDHVLVRTISQPDIQSVPLYGHILIHTRSDDTVIGASANIRHISGVDTFSGKTLAEVVPIPKQDWRNIRDKLLTGRKLTDLPVLVRNRSGALQEMWLNGLAIFNPQEEYAGANLLLRLLADDTSFDRDLSQDNKAMARHVLDHSGSSYKTEIGQFLMDYYLYYLKELFAIAYHRGGTPLSQGLLNALAGISQQHSWPMQFNPQTVLDNVNFPLEVLREALPLLLKTAENYVSNITGAQMVTNRMKELSTQISEAVHKDVVCYLVPDSEVRFADLTRQ